MSSNHPLANLQAEYRNKILASGFRLDVISEEEHEDGVGAVAGNNYRKGGWWYGFEDALEEIGELDNYRKDRSAVCKEAARQVPRFSWDEYPNGLHGYVSPDIDQ